MNYRRQEMEATLPEGSKFLAQHLWYKLHEAGVNTIPENDIRLIARLVSDFIKNTPEGKKAAIKLLNAEVRQADYRHAYFPDGKAHDLKNRIPHTELVEYRGWVYKNTYSVPYSSVDIDQNGNLEACEATGILGPKDYCVKVVRVVSPSGRETLQSLSNYARLLSEDTGVRDTASQEKCRNCFVKGCEYHPAKQVEQQLPLLPVRKTP